MKRNAQFRNDREPMRSHDSLEILPGKIKGPFPFSNPTSALFRHLTASTTPLTDTPSPPRPKSEVSYLWKSRNNRKGRHELRIQAAEPHTKTDFPRDTSTFPAVLLGIWRMFTYAPVWDISYLIAVIFTIGSVIWCINALLTFLPLIRPNSEFPGEVLVGGGVTAFIGATVFEIGSLLLILEAVNENRDGCFGWAVQSAWEDVLERAEKARDRRVKVIADRDECSHHHRNKKNLVGKSTHCSDLTSDGKADNHGETGENARSWTWWPSWDDLKSHYFHEIGFIACFSQLMGASVFWISGFTALPGIQNHLSPGLEDGIFWTPQIIGGTGFIISGTLFMIETQDVWWRPAFHVLGWHIGFWNLVGGIGFTLCPAFGYDSSSWAQFQSTCATFWGSWAFLIGSTIQWYESLDKYPIQVRERETPRKRS